jgi:hypothetical protein
MPQISSLTTPRLDDKTSLDLFRKVSATGKPQNFYVNISALPSIDALKGSDSNLLKEVDSVSSFLISRIQINYPGLTIEYIRGGSAAPPSAIYDEVKFSQHDNQQNALPSQDRIKIIKMINEVVGPSPMAGMFAQQSSGGLSDLEGLYRSTVLRLETKFAEQIDKITSWTVEQTGLHPVPKTPS